MKTCNSCKQEKPLSSFAKNSKKPDGLQKECKECKNEYNRDYYKTNKAAQYERVRERSIKLRAEYKEYVWNLKRNPCTDCGNVYHPFVMDFDHVRGSKVSNIHELVSSGCKFQKLLDEIAKCELVCANCHRLRTGIRAGIIDE